MTGDCRAPDRRGEPKNMATRFDRLRMRRRNWRAVVTGVTVVAQLLVLPHHSRPAPTFAPPIQLRGAVGGSEPRVAVAPDGIRYVITNDAKTGQAIVYRSADGLHWSRTAGDPAGQTQGTIDTDIVATRPFNGAPDGRLVAAELDGGGINFRVSYSDDGGRTWHVSLGPTLADQDRQWLATGPIDPTTGMPRVYLLFHNLLSGTASHNMYVATSTDGGATFGPPVPITLPPSQAWLDLQCADSGGPSDLFVNQKTGAVYAVWGSRSAPVGGGCGASAFGPLEVNVVAATRVWVATASAADANRPGGWKDSLAVNDSSANGGAGKIVGMQLAPGTVDSSGNVYVAYPESIHAYPDYDGASIKYVWAPGDLAHWSTPVSVAPSGGPGNVLPHIVAGDKGQLDFAYFVGTARRGHTPTWHVVVAQTRDALAASPTFRRLGVSARIVTYTGTASQLMGACGSGPLEGVQNGFACSRSTDVWGIALDHACRLILAWPVAGKTFNNVDPKAAGTYVSTQTGGTTVCD